MIKTSIYGNIKVVGAYGSGNPSLVECDYEKIFENDNTPTICMSDFNAIHRHWNSRLTNSRGRKLFNIALDLNL